MQVPKLVETFISIHRGRNYVSRATTKLLPSNFSPECFAITRDKGQARSPELHRNTLADADFCVNGNTMCIYNR